MWDVRTATARDHTAAESLLGDQVGAGAVAGVLADPDGRVLLDAHEGRAALLVRDPRRPGAALLVAAVGVDQDDVDVVDAARWLGCTAVDHDGGRTVPVPPLADDAPLPLRFLDRAARAASRAVEVAARLADHGRADRKPDGSPQVEADRRIDEVTAAVFDDLDLPLLSEERADPIDFLGPWGVVDPLDGTGNYLAGLPAYAFSAGLVGTDGAPVAGFVADLSSGRRWWGAVGHGAWRDGSPAGPRAGTTLVLPTPPAGASATVLDGFRRLRITGCTAVDLCLVADGSAAAWHDLDRAGTYVHDVAGGLGVAAAAGAVALDPDGDPVRLRPDTATAFRFVLAADAGTATRIRSAGPW
jgi:3'(2'), 5'-bisphosphate nucleotidase